MNRSQHGKAPDDSVVVGQQRDKGPSPKGRVTGPSRQPRRHAPTDASIGRGEELIRPRRPRERDDLSSG